MNLEVNTVMIFLGLLIMLTGFQIVFRSRWFERLARVTSIITARGNPVKSLWRQVAVTVVLLALSQSAFAANPPSAGSQFQQIPPSPIIQKEVPKIQI